MMSFQQCQALPPTLPRPPATSQTVRILVMRHSLRVDEVPGFIRPEEWPDRVTRPHDPPIVDGIANCLARERTEEMRRALVECGGSRVRAIVSSPYVCRLRETCRVGLRIW
jgi:hypothetical protein